MAKKKIKVGIRLMVALSFLLHDLPAYASPEFHRYAALNFTRAENYLAAAAADETNSYAYFCPNSSPGQIIKVAVPSLTRVGSLILPPGENELISSLIPPGSPYAYFGLSWQPGFSPVPGKIVRVRLSDFTRVDVLTLLGDENAKHMTVDQNGQFLYALNIGFPAKIIKIRLSDFTRIGVLSLPADESAGSMVYDKIREVLYVGVTKSSTLSVIRKIRLSDFSLSSTLPLPASDQSLTAAAIDKTETFAYFGHVEMASGALRGGKITKIRLSDFSIVGSVRTPNSEVGFQSSFISPDDATLYLSGYRFGESSTMTKIRLSDFTRVGGFTTAPDKGYTAMAALPASNEALLASFVGVPVPESAGRIVRVRLSDMVQTASVDLNAGEGSIFATLVDAAQGVAILSLATMPPKVAKVRLSDLTRLSTLTLNPDDGRILTSFTPGFSVDYGTPRTGFIDAPGNFAYLASHTSPAKIIKIRLSDLSRVSALTLNAGDDRPQHCFYDAVSGIAYFLCRGTPYRLVKVRISDMTHQGSFSFPADHFITTMLVDPAANMVWAARTLTSGTTVTGGNIRKYSLSNFQLLSSVDINARDFQSCLSDGGDHAYFIGPRIIKLRKSSLAVDGSLIYGDGRSKGMQGVLHKGFLYIGGDGDPAHVMKIRLSDFSSNEVIQFDPYENNVVSAGVDPVNGYAYFGTDTSPGHLIKVFIGTGSSPPTNFPPTISDIYDRTVNEDQATGAVPFTIGDAETPAANLLLSKTSSNPVLVPMNNIVLSGSGAARTVTVTPMENQFGSATITITVGDGNNNLIADSFVLTVTPVNDPPFISDVQSQSTLEGTSTAAIPFTVNDVETAGNLTVTAHSADQTIVPDGNITLAGNGQNRTITMRPVPNRSGTTLMTLMVSDGNGGTATDTFMLTVGGSNDPPTMTPVNNRTINEDADTGPVAFNVADTDSALSSLTLSKTSSNPSLVPAGNIVFGGSGADRTVTVTPSPNQSGSAILTLTVSDGIASASSAFTLTVTPVNDAPVISGLANKTTPANTAITMGFSIDDVDSSLSALQISGESSNPILVPIGNMELGGAGANKTLRVVPMAGQSGSVTLTLTVTDGEHSSSQNFILIVNPPVDLDDPVEPAPIDRVLNIKTNEPLPVGFYMNEEPGTIEIFTREGLLVKTFSGATKTTMWDGRNDAGDNVSSGVYIVKTDRGNTKIVVVK